MNRLRALQQRAELVGLNIDHNRHGAEHPACAQGGRSAGGCAAGEQPGKRLLNSTVVFRNESPHILIGIDFAFAPVWPRRIRCRVRSRWSPPLDLDVLTMMFDYN